MNTARATSTRSGILLVDKPSGITSHGVVARTRKVAGTRKVGHAGTLDPMATGLLVLGINSSTRLLTYLVGLDKEYFATIRLGSSTSTDDAEGDTLESVDASHLTAEQIESAIAPLRGAIEQVPSSVSAIKVDGKRAYALVREGETVALKSRAVMISAFDVIAVRHDGMFTDVEVRVVCSSGTYIRALARDIGTFLAVGGHLTALRRTRIGPFSIADAAELDDLAPETDLLAPAAVAATLFATYDASAQDVVDLVHGKRIQVSALEGAEGPVAAIAPDGRLVGLLSITGDVARPLINFPSDEVLA